ncbi:MAG: Stp1/IreP family PP2C-type Ser/Thr phosphatase [Sodaliphilus sp.]
MENYILANCTDAGKVRSVNEDAMATFDSPNGRVVVVCDGMGGQNAGDVASQLAVAVIQDILSDNTFPSPEEAITRSIMAANQAILRRAAQDDALSGMGATCVMAIINQGKVYYGSVGDSRIYYIANGAIRQVTKDQSYVQTLVDEGRISKEAAEHHQDKNQITNALGIENMQAPVICQMPIVPEPGSVLLLCTDGLSGMINNNVILSTVTNHNVPLLDRAQQLVNLANAAGGLDNITVQLVEFSGAPAAGVYPATATPAYVNKKAKSGKNTTAILAIAMLLVAVVGGGAYWFFSSKQAKPKPAVVTPAPAQQQPVAQKQQIKEVKETIIVRQEASSSAPSPKKATNKNGSSNSNKKAKNPAKLITKKPGQPTKEVPKDPVTSTTNNNSIKQTDLRNQKEDLTNN